MPIPSGAYAMKKLGGGASYYGVPIVEGSINEDTPSYCDFTNPETNCTAIGQYTLVVTNAVVTDLVWSTTKGSIVSGQGTSTVQVSFEDDETSTFELHITGTVTPTVGDPYQGAGVATFTTTHEDISTPLTISSIDLDSGGSCIYNPGGACQATSVYSVTTSNGNGAKTYEWSISGDATIQGSNIEETVTVLGTLDDDADVYNLTCEVTDNTGAPELTTEFTDTKVEDPAISIISINRDSGGTCDYLSHGSCVAQSVYSVTYENDTGNVGYAWSVDGGATIVGNTALSTVTVNGTDSDTDDSYNVTVVLTDDNSTDTETTEFTDAKTESDVDPDAWGTLPQGLGTVNPSATINSISTDRSGVWCTGHSGGYASRSDDNGETWWALPSGLNSGYPSASINSIESDTNGTWVSGHSFGYASRSVDNGLTWSALPPGLNCGVINTDIYAMETDTDGTWIAGFAGGYASISTDNGATWTALERGLNCGIPTANVLSIAGYNGTWIAGFAGGYASRSDDNGATWTALERGLNTGGLLDFTTIETDDAGTWISGQAEGYASISHDDGLTWSTLEPGLSSGSNTADVFTMVSNGAGAWVAGLEEGHASFSVNNGDTWTALPQGLNSGAITQNILSLDTDRNSTWLAVQSGGYASRNPPIHLEVTDIILDSGGSCEYEKGGTCQATSVYSATTKDGYGTPAYEWTVTGEATISGSNTESTVEVIGLDDADDDTYNVEVSITDFTGTTTLDKDFTDTKTESPSGIIRIDSAQILRTGLGGIVNYDYVLPEGDNRQVVVFYGTDVNGSNGYVQTFTCTLGGRSPTTTLNRNITNYSLLSGVYAFDESALAGLSGTVTLRFGNSGSNSGNFKTGMGVATYENVSQGALSVAAAVSSSTTSRTVGENGAVASFVTATTYLGTFVSSVNQQVRSANNRGFADTTTAGNLPNTLNENVSAGTISAGTTGASGNTTATSAALELFDAAAIATNPNNLDGDEFLDTEIYDAHGTRITEDEDSINIDLDGDDIADIIIPKEDE